MAMIQCALHGNQSVVFVYSEDAEHFSTQKSSENANDWTVCLTSLDEIVEWHILIKSNTLRSCKNELEKLGARMIDKSMPVCKACVERAFGDLWNNLYIKKYRWTS